MTNPEKVRASLYLERDLWERAKAITEQTGGVISASSMVNDFLRHTVPFVEEAVRKAQEGDREALLQFFDAFLAGSVVDLGAQAGSIRTNLREKAGKEAST